MTFTFESHDFGSHDFERRENGRRHHRRGGRHGGGPGGFPGGPGAFPGDAAGAFGMPFGGPGAGAGFGPGGPGGPFGPGGPGGRGGRGERRAGRRRRRGDVRTGILLLLTEGPQNGYGLIRELAERSGGAWRPSSGAVYPALAQLEDEGLVEPAEEAGRKHVRLTDAGRAEAQQLASRPSPWEEAAEEAAPGPAAHRAWQSFQQLALAVRAVVETGDDGAVTLAAEELDSARRRLYRVLAEPATGEAAGNDPAGDDEDTDTDE